MIDKLSFKDLLVIFFIMFILVRGFSFKDALFG